MPCAGLGIQRLISDRRLYDYDTPAGRDYTGEDPHTGHAHIEFSWRTSRSLTLDRVRDLLRGERDEAVEIQEAYAALAQKIGSKDAEGTILGDLEWVKGALAEITRRLPA